MVTKNHHNFLQIGEIAAKAGTSTRTVRFYLEEGFIEAAARSPGGFYLFTPDTAETVFFVQKLKAAGMTLKEIKALFGARRRGQSGHEAYSRVRDHLEKQKALMEQKIADYQRLQNELTEAIDLVSQCDGCRLEPTRQNCIKCPVVTSRQKIPLPFQAIL